MKITRKSPLSGNLSTMDLDVTDDQISAYMNGTFVQDACPKLNAHERESVLTGITPAEWDKTFPEEDEAV